MNIHKWRRDGDKYVGIGQMTGWVAWESPNGWWGFTEPNGILHSFIKVKHETPEDAMFDVERFSLNMLR